MRKGGADLHFHSRHSDGSHAPAELVRMAAQQGLEAVSLTDHDTVAGWAEARAEGDRCHVMVLPGVELGARFQGQDIHLLAYGFEPDHPGLLAALATHRRERETRLGRMVARLQEAGVSIRIEELAPATPGSSRGRPHLADGLLRRGVVASFQEAFERYLKPGRPGYVPRSAFTLAQARDVVDAAHGVIVLAHPHLNLSMEGIRNLVKEGVDGLEVTHPGLKKSQSRKLRALAREEKLLTTGGSDFHGSDRGPILIGSVHVPLEAVEKIKAACAAKSRISEKLSQVTREDS